MAGCYAALVSDKNVELLAKSNAGVFGEDSAGLEVLLSDAILLLPRTYCIPR